MMKTTFLMLVVALLCANQIRAPSVAKPEHSAKTNVRVDEDDNGDQTIVTQMVIKTDNKQVKKLTADLENLVTNVVSLTEKISSLSNEGDKTSSKLCQLISQVDTEAQNTKKFFENISQELLTLNNKLGENDKLTIEQGKQLAAIKEKLNGQHTRLEGLDKSIARLTDQMAQQNITISTNTSDLKHLSADILRQESNITKNANDIRNLQHNSQQQQNQLDNTAKSVADNAQELKLQKELFEGFKTAQTEVHKRLQEQINAQNSTSNNQAQQIANVGRTVDQHASRLQAHDQRALNNDLNNVNTQGVIAGLKKALSNSEARMKIFENNVQDVTTKMDRMQMGYEKKIDNLTSTVMELTSKLELTLKIVQGNADYNQCPLNLRPHASA